jgi:hypothetical protein
MRKSISESTALARPAHTVFAGRHPGRHPRITGNMGVKGRAVHPPICAVMGGSGGGGESGEDVGECQVETVWVFHHDEMAHVVNDRQVNVIGVE